MSVYTTVWIQAWLLLMYGAWIDTNVWWALFVIILCSLGLWITNACTRVKR